MKEKNRSKITTVLSVVALSLIALFLWQHFIANTPKVVEEEDVFVISENASIPTNKQGEYLYEDIDGKSLGSYQKIIPSSKLEAQKNKCVKELLEKRTEYTTDTCLDNGYTYLLISRGTTYESVNIEMEPLEVSEDNKLIVKYRLVVNEGYDKEKAVFYLFQIPTNKEIEFKPLSYLSEEELSTPYLKVLYENVKNENLEEQQLPAENTGEEEVGTEEVVNEE